MSREASASSTSAKISKQSRHSWEIYPIKLLHLYDKTFVSLVNTKYKQIKSKLLLKRRKTLHLCIRTSHPPFFRQVRMTSQNNTVRLSLLSSVIRIHGDKQPFLYTFSSYLNCGAIKMSLVSRFISKVSHKTAENYTCE